MEVRILGPLEVWVDGRRVELGAGRQRALLALLVLNRNRVVSGERLIDELWGEQPPATAAKGLQNLVAQLRKALAAREGVIATHAPGYVLRLDDDALDAARFERLAVQGRAMLEHEPASAANRLREALALWRGEALADFAYERFAESETQRLEELRLGAVEDRIEAELALGAGSELIAELEALVAAHPMRDRLRAQIMLALYRSGRQTDALEVYAEASRALRDELGLEPSAALKQLQRAILAHDPTLGSPPRLPRLARMSRRRRLAVAVAAAALLVVAGSLAVTAVVGRGEAVPRVVPNSLVRIDARTNEIVDVVPVGRDPGPLAVVGDHVFVAGQEDGTVTRVNGLSGEVTTSGRHDVTGSIAGAGDRSLWVVSVPRREVTWLDAASLERVDGVALPPALQAWVEVGGDSLWVSQWYPPAVTRWRLRTLQLTRRYPLLDAEYPLEVAFGHGAAWVALWSTNRLLRIDAVDGRTSYIRVGNGPRDPSVGFGSLWVAMAEDSTIWRIDPRSRRIQAVIEVGELPWGVAVGQGAVWVANNCAGTVSRIDPQSNEVVATIDTGLFPQWLATRGRDVWVGLAETWSPVPGSGPSSLEGCNSRRAR